MFPGNGIVILCGILFINFLEKLGGGPISSVFSVVSVEITDTVCGFVVASPLEIFHDRFLGGAVSFLGHDGFGLHDGEFLCV